MKTGFRTGGFGQRSIKESCSAIRRAGYDGVELCLEHKEILPTVVTPTLAQDILRYLADIGLDVEFG